MVELKKDIFLLLFLLFVASMMGFGIFLIIYGFEEIKQYKCLEPYAKDYCNLRGYKFEILETNSFSHINSFQCGVPSKDMRKRSTVEYFVYSEEELKNCGVK